MRDIACNHGALAGYVVLKDDYRRWGIAPRPENVFLTNGPYRSTNRSFVHGDIRVQRVIRIGHFIECGRYAPCARHARPLNLDGMNEMRRKLVWGNWKMNGSAAANAALPGSLAMHAKSIAGRVDVGVCVPAVYLEQDRRELAGATAAWGVQDVSAHECGAYTGEISEHMVSEFGATYAIVGHSERRINHGETGATIGEKARQALSAGLVPVVCVGESEAQRDAGIAEEYVCVQLTAVLNVLAPGQAEQIVVAYEPVWAIGTGRSATAARRSRCTPRFARVCWRAAADRRT